MFSCRPGINQVYINICFLGLSLVDEDCMNHVTRKKNLVFFREMMMKMLPIQGLLHWELYDPHTKEEFNQKYYKDIEKEDLVIYNSIYIARLK